MTAPIDPVRILDALKVDDIQSIASVAGGFGGTTLWRVRRAASPNDLLLRLFPDTPLLLAMREASAHRAARHGDIPAPEIIAVGEGERHAAIVMTWAPGVLLLDTLMQVSGQLDRLHRLGTSCGEMLARLHLVPAPPEIVNAGRDWIEWAGPITERLRPRLEHATTMMRDRLLHLDFHPGNILVEGDAISAVIDWTNARSGPPAADLARTRSILRLVRLHPNFPASMESATVIFEQALLDAWARVHPLPDLAPFDAWALAVQVEDLTPALSAPNTWLTPAILANVQEERDRRIANLEFG